jgi:hypothetical protein
MDKKIVDALYANGLIQKVGIDASKYESVDDLIKRGVITFPGVKNKIDKILESLNITHEDKPQVIEPIVEDLKTDEPVITDAPAEETPIDETPVSEEVIIDTPVDETPIEETPVEEPTITETVEEPVEETAEVVEEVKPKKTRTKKTE